MCQRSASHFARYLPYISTLSSLAFTIDEEDALGGCVKRMGSSQYLKEGGNREDQGIQVEM